MLYCELLTTAGGRYANLMIWVLLLICELPRLLSSVPKVQGADMLFKWAELDSLVDGLVDGVK